MNREMYADHLTVSPFLCMLFTGKLWITSDVFQKISSYYSKVTVRKSNLIQRTS